MTDADSATVLGSVVHIIQVALTPVFLLSGIATLLNVFSTRLARVADRVDELMKAMEAGADSETGETGTIAARLSHLHRRSVALNIAVLLGAAAGAATCATVLALFIGEAGALAVAAILYVSFGLAIACTIGAIVSFAFEMTIAGRHTRAEAALGRQIAQPEPNGVSGAASEPRP